MARYGVGLLFSVKLEVLNYATNASHQKRGLAFASDMIMAGGVGGQSEVVSPSQGLAPTTHATAKYDTSDRRA